MKLKHVTKGKTVPSILPGVFLVCHPKDFYLYFGEISGKLIEAAPCTVWYTDASGGSEAGGAETVKKALSSMRLLVIVATTRLLSTKNDCMDRILPCAVFLKMPVLCLLAERGIAEFARELIPNAYHLPLHPLDAARISFEDRLSRILPRAFVADRRKLPFSYLIGRGGENNPRHAFSLQWKFAGTAGGRYGRPGLMGRTAKGRLILAIRYAKEHLFLAKLSRWDSDYSAHGPRYFMEVDEICTDEKLWSDFDSSKQPDEEYCRLLWEALDLAIEAWNSAAARSLVSPVNGFAKALADFQWALERTGRQKRFVECIRCEDFPQAKSGKMKIRQNKDAWSNLCRITSQRRGAAAFHAGMCLNALERYREACEVFAAAEDDLDIFGCLAYAGALGETGRMEEAGNWFERAFELAKEQAQKSGKPFDRRLVGLCHRNLGHFFAESKENEKAQAHFAQAKEIFEKLCAETESMEDALNLACSLDELGDVAKAGGDPDEALCLYGEALELRRQMHEIHCDESSDTAAAHRCIDYGMTAMKSDRKDAAMEHFQTALKFLEQTEERAKSAMWRDDMLAPKEDNSDLPCWFADKDTRLAAFRALRDVKEWIGFLAVSKGDVATVEKAYEMALHLSDAIARQTRMPDDFERAYAIGDRYGKFRGDLGRPPMYTRHIYYDLSKLLKLWQKIDGSAEVRRYRLDCLLKANDAMDTRNLLCCQLAREILESLVREKMDPDDVRKLCEVLEWLSDLYLDEDDKEHSEECLERIKALRH